MLAFSRRTLFSSRNRAEPDDIGTVTRSEKRGVSFESQRRELPRGRRSGFRRLQIGLRETVLKRARTAVIGLHVIYNACQFECFSWFNHTNSTDRDFQKRVIVVTILVTDACHKRPRVLTTMCHNISEVLYTRGRPCKSSKNLVMLIMVDVLTSCLYTKQKNDFEVQVYDSLIKHCHV